MFDNSWTAQTLRGKLKSQMSSASEDLLAKKIFDSLKEIQDPDLNKDIVSLGFVKNLLLKKNLLGKYDVSFEIELTTPACPVKDLFKKQAEQLLRKLDEINNVQVKMTAQVKAGKKKNSIDGVKNIIAVGSGKGGVGKSTVAVNLAFALKHLGARVALLDADIYGPSLAQMLHLTSSPKVENHRIIPIEAYGIPTMTFAFFAPVGEAVIWRGPQIAKAVEQMMKEVNWRATPNNPDREDIDYLIVDLPPGTGDIAITTSQTVALSGAVLVSTPQEISLIDTLRGFYMFEKLKVPVLGLIENMSGFICGECGAKTDIFGSGGAQKKAQEKGIPFLGTLPLHPLIVTKGDKGLPLVEAEKDHFVSKVFLEIASRIAQELSKINHKESLENDPQVG
jgi:ATP-binding protein involved in chromosome partitioning